MEPNSLIFLTPITKLQSHLAAIWLSAKYPQRPFPASKPLDCIACKVLTHYKSLINPPSPSLRMRSQTPPFLLKKCENCHKNIIKVPLHVPEMFGTIHTIQYHCIKYCSQGRRRGYYNGLYRGAIPKGKQNLNQGFNKIKPDHSHLLWNNWLLRARYGWYSSHITR